MDQVRSNNNQIPGISPAMPSKDDFVSLQSLSEALKTFNSFAESGAIPDGHLVASAKEIIPQLRAYYSELLKTVFK